MRTTDALPGWMSEEPYGLYDQLRESGDVIWDDSTASWLVTTYTGCKEMLAADDVVYRSPEIDPALAEMFLAIHGGGRVLTLLKDEEHLRIHRWWMQIFSPKAILRWRDDLLRPMVAGRLDDIEPRGRADLEADLADELPIRTIAAILGLPWEDDDWIGQVRSLMAELAPFFGQRPWPLASAHEKALAASMQLNDVFLPFVRERRLGTGDDLISRTWREGSDLLADWDEMDVLSTVRLMFLGGTETTKMSMVGMFYLLMTVDGMQDRLKEANEAVRKRYVEEALRLRGPLHVRPRFANRDTTLCGKHIKKDDVLYGFLASADRDPVSFDDPGEIRLDRAAPRGHLAFSFGPRTCVGAALARAELLEAVDAVVHRLPNLRPDPDAEQPSMFGSTTKSIRPLHAIWDPR
jgi:cytochrome P450